MKEWYGIKTRPPRGSKTGDGPQQDGEPSGDAAPNDGTEEAPAAEGGGA